MEQQGIITSMKGGVAEITFKRELPATHALLKSEVRGTLFETVEQKDARTMLAIALSSSEQVERGEKVNAIGENISVETPSGKITLVTDSQGKVMVNAAEAGTYKFTYQNLSSTTKVPAAPKPPGSDRDAHGCIPSAGYTWCEEKQKCLRPWEEECALPQPSAASPQQQDYTGAAFGLFAISAVIGIMAIVIAAKLLLPALKHGKPKHEEKHKPEAGAKASKKHPRHGKK